MGNTSSTTVEENPKTTVEKNPKTAVKTKRRTTVKPAHEKIPVRGSVYRGYQPSIEFMKGRSMGKNSVINDERDNDSPTPSESNLRETHASSSNKNSFPYDDRTKQATSTKEQSSSVFVKNTSNEKPLSPSFIQTKVSSQADQVYVPQPSIFNNVSYSNTAAANSFEKAPTVKINYVVKPSEKNSKHIYELGNITVMRRTSSQATPYGGRWYDNDYNKNIKPPIVKYS
ncbi:unnamed protein product [Rotaria sp. Silwood2]|nr:unnamed protein product [Rotaria sp. Silwood2]CAF2876318.1 unnamed protein product [Rotaria sp. Silwood2]CAF3045184.1 unnamed protein product [Rotaria sp. Silwood2]CAF3227887.1 unnamed protein product [Rotaria sp. Silwood2]CAF3903376.1 unnamed protein product [Rotaria sp. Silwood2]